MTAWVRGAVEADLGEITRIYNHYVRETAITFDMEPSSVEARRPWFETFGEAGPHRLLVLTRDEHVLGYASSQRFRVKPAYDTTVETSVYLDPAEGGRGYGTRLYGALFDALAGTGLHRAVAGITLPNAASLALHARFDFKHTGVMSEVGCKLGRYWDVAWLEKPLA